MSCQRCGYVLQPFEAECPKCARMARAGQMPGQAFAGAAGSWPAVQTGIATNGQPFKICPVCSQPAAMTMLQCGRCGFAYFSASNAGAAQGAENWRSAGDNNSRIGYAVAAIGGMLCLLLVAVYALIPHTPHGKLSSAERLTMLGAKGGGLFGAINERQFDARLASAAATTGGDVEVSLAWNTLSDLDLQVREPSGELITASHPKSASGGTQDVDANPTLVTDAGHALLESGRPCGAENILPLPDFLVDFGDKMHLPNGFPGMEPLSGRDGKAQSKFTRTPVEHTYFQQAPSGVYTVYAQCYSWREPNRSPMPFTVLVRSHGRTISSVSGTIGPACFAIDGVSAVQVCQLAIR